MYTFVFLIDSVYQYCVTIICILNVLKYSIEKQDIKKDHKVHEKQNLNTE